MKIACNTKIHGKRLRVVPLAFLMKTFVPFQGPTFYLLEIIYLDHDRKSSAI
jgi:hypothetical protein